MIFQEVYNKRRLNDVVFARNVRANGAEHISDATVAAWLAGTNCPRSQSEHNAALKALGIYDSKFEHADAKKSELIDAFAEIEHTGFTNFPERSDHVPDTSWKQRITGSNLWDHTAGITLNGKRYNPYGNHDPLDNVHIGPLRPMELKSGNHAEQKASRLVEPSSQGMIRTARTAKLTFSQAFGEFLSDNTNHARYMEVVSGNFNKLPALLDRLSREGFSENNCNRIIHDLIFRAVNAWNQEFTSREARHNPYVQKAETQPGTLLPKMFWQVRLNQFLGKENIYEGLSEQDAERAERWVKIVPPITSQGEYLRTLREVNDLHLRDVVAQSYYHSNILAEGEALTCGELSGFERSLNQVNYKKVRPDITLERVCKTLADLQKLTLIVGFDESKFKGLEYVPSRATKRGVVASLSADEGCFVNNSRS